MSSGWNCKVLVKALISALCGSLASVCGKLAFDTSRGSLLEQRGFDFLPVRGVLFILLLLLNSVMLSLFVRVLQSVSALQASLLAFVCNYLISTAVGIALFGEAISLQWLLGAVIMTLGAVRISSSKQPTDKNSTRRKSSNKKEQ